jgi:hypothetical protein
MNRHRPRIPTLTAGVQEKQGKKEKRSRAEDDEGESKCVVCLFE